MDRTVGRGLADWSLGGGRYCWENGRGGGRGEDIGNAIVMDPDREAFWIVFVDR